jgi:FkbM family methyltransferase
MIATLSACTAWNKSIPIILGPLRGKRLPKRVALHNLHMLIGQYEPYIISEILSTPSPGTIAYDVGGHIGIMTLALAERVGRKGKVFSFEPCPANRVWIEELVSRNSLSAVVRVIDVALANRNGREDLFLGDTSFINYIGTALNGQPVDKSRAIKVRTSTLDSFIFEGPNPPPELMKIDVEGAEALVLQGAQKTLENFHPKLMMEIHGRQNAETVWDILHMHGYRWMRLAKQGRFAVSTQQELISLFSKYQWPHHFLVTPKP